MSFILYGANGYTASVILEQLEAYDLKPVIAGRSSEKIKALAEKFKLEYLIFDLDDEENVQEKLRGFKVLLNCAGPFQKTAKALVNACIAKGIHYLDITGEIAVFEWVKIQHRKAVEAGVCLVPGVGFDVVPTDCVAGFLHEKMPDANKLTLAFAFINGNVSHGTATTMVQNLGTKGVVRENGRLKLVPQAHKGQKFDFNGKELFAVTIPWGDISTAYTSTGIPNIEVFSAFPPKNTYKTMKWQWAFNWILRMSFVKKIIQKRIDKTILGPDAARRKEGQSIVLGFVENEKGDVLKAKLVGCEAYEFTVHASLLAVKKMLEHSYEPGYYTPASIFGHQFALEIPGTTMELV